MATEEGAFCFPQKVDSFQPEGGCWLWLTIHTPPLPLFDCMTSLQFWSFEHNQKRYNM